MTALVEGDATSVEDDYLFSLPQADQDAYFAEDADVSPVDESPIDEDAPSDIPPVLDLFMSGPYIFGPRSRRVPRDACRRHGSGRPRLRPPTPYRRGDHRPGGGPSRAGRSCGSLTPKLQRGEHRRGEPYDFGALSLYLVLASRVDPQVALRGWQRVWAATPPSASRSAARTTSSACASPEVTPTSTPRRWPTRSAQWTVALPAGAATSERVGDRVHLTVCDAGTTAAPSEDVLDAAVTLLVDRNDLAVELLGAKLPPRVTRCAADRLAADPALVGVLLGLDEFTDAQQDQFSDRVSSVVSACRTR